MKKITTIVLVTLLLILAGSAGVIIFIDQENAKAEKSEETVNTESFAGWTDCEVFQNVPALTGKEFLIGEAVDYGNGHYMIDVNGTSTADYQGYLATLEKAGFKKHSDNGEEAMEGYVMTASYTKDNLVITVAQAVRMNKTYISGSYDLPLSEHLIYKDEYVANVKPEAKTSLHMLELNDNGNSFVIQLKNGHFVVHDGGTTADAPYLLDYLESLTPEGEKPVIEGWFISHAHSDHSGALIEIAFDESSAGRVLVNGFYFMEPSQKLLTMMEDDGRQSWNVARINSMFSSENGDKPKVYRPQFGQRYYFCDIAIDVSLTFEQYPEDSYYSADFNETSLWLMHHIDEQKFLVAGDTSHTGMRMATYVFDEEYFDLDVFAVSHHGINVYDYFTDYCTMDTILYTSFRMGSIWTDGTWKEAKTENEHLQETVKESYHRGNGTVVLTFPYKVGEAKVLEPCDWRYNLPAGQPYRSAWGN